jgi:hypothetical protein
LILDTVPYASLGSEKFRNFNLSSIENKMELSENSPSGLNFVLETVRHYSLAPVLIEHTFRLSETKSFTLSIEIPEKFLINGSLPNTEMVTEKVLDGIGVEKTRFSNKYIPFFCRKQLSPKEFPDVLELYVKIHERRVQICASTYVKLEKKRHIMRFERFTRHEKPLVPNPKITRRFVKGTFEIIILPQIILGVPRAKTSQKDIFASEIAKLIDISSFFDN